LLAKPSSCQGCPLERAGGIGWSNPTGPLSSNLFIVGEALGEEEVKTGTQFVGAAGNLLNRLLYRLGVDRAELVTDNILRCRPPMNKLVGAPYELGAIAHCKPNLVGSLRDWLNTGSGEKIVIALGSTATRSLLSLTKKGYRHENWHGSIIPAIYGGLPIKVMPTFHPSHLLQGNSKLTGAVLHDLRKAIEASRGEATQDETILTVDPALDWFTDWAQVYMDSPESWLAVDIETADTGGNIDEEELTDAYSTILRINLAYNKDHGVTVPWREPYIPIVTQMLQANKVQCYWNARFDVPRLTIAGVEPKGKILDFMWGWHMLQSDMPMGLGFVAPFYSSYGPWKHLSHQDPGKYAAIDAVQTLRCAFGITKDLEAAGQWEVFGRHIYKLDTLVLHPAEKIGMLCDKQKLADYKVELQDKMKEVTEKLQILAPESVCPLSPKGGWKRLPSPEPPGLLKIKERALVKVCLGCETVGITAKHSACAAPQVVTEEREVLRFYIREAFNPGSTKQILSYLQLNKQAAGRSKHTAGPSVDRKVLETLWKKTKDGFYKHLIEYRDLDKLLNTYVMGVEKRLG